MTYRSYAPPAPRLFGYDPYLDLPKDHLARLVERVVESALGPPPPKPNRGYPAFDPRLCIKVLVYGYSVGVRSSRQLERLCRENLAFLFLTRGDTPSYRTLCTVRTQYRDQLEQVWVALLAVAQEAGVPRLGKITIDSTKMRADASSEAVLRQCEYEDFRNELERILEEAKQADLREEAEGSAAQMQVDVQVSEDQMRDILRRVRKERHQAKRADPITTDEPADQAEPQAQTWDPSGADEHGKDEHDDTSGSGTPSDESSENAPAVRWIPSPKMRERIEQTMDALAEAIQEKRKHLCVTDPDARMMPSGVTKRVLECHSLEVAADNGLIVAAGTTTQSDNARLEPMIAAARIHEPEGVTQAVADSGYYGGDAIARLTQSGVDVCVPDSYTAYDLHHQQEIGFLRSHSKRTVAMTYVPEEDVYLCPEGNRLVFTQQRLLRSATVREYRAQRPCRECPLASACLKQAKAKHRNLKVSIYEGIHQVLREQFTSPERQELYRQRAQKIETVFGFLRSCLGFHRWSLRGEARVACEGMLMVCGYQFRKVATILAS